MNLMIFYNFYNDIRWDLIGTYEHFMIFMGTSWDIGFNQPKRFRHPQPGDTWCFMNPGWSLQDYDELWGVHCGSLLKYGLGAEHDLWSLWYFYNGEMIWYTKTMNWVCLSMGNLEYRYEKMTNNDKIWGLISGKIGKLLYDMHMMLHSHQQHFSLALKATNPSSDGSIATRLERVSLALPAARLKIWVECNAQQAACRLNTFKASRSPVILRFWDIFGVAIGTVPSGCSKLPYKMGRVLAIALGSRLP